MAPHGAVSAGFAVASAVAVGGDALHCIGFHSIVFE